jgi:phage gpG-like protein
MTGVAFELTFDDAAILGGLGRIEASLLDTAPLLSQIGNAGVDSTKLRFATQAGPDGSPWPGLSPAYAMLPWSSAGRGYGMLRASEALLKSQHYVLGADEVSWGSDRPYAAVHQFGATIVPKNAKALAFVLGDTFAKGNSGALGNTQAHLVLAQSVTIPARPYLGLDEVDKTEITALARDYILGQLLSRD